MDPNKSSSASPSAVPSPSTNPPPSDASPLTFIDQELDGNLESLPGGGPSESWKLMEAILLFELAGNDAGSYDTVVQEGERALLIENRTDPGDEDSVPAWRIEGLRKEVLEMIEKSKRQIIVLGGGNRRDKWKRLLEDNSLAEVKAEFEATLQRKKRIPGRKPLDFKSPSPDDRFKIKKHKKVESNDVATISRVRAFWNDGMSVESKRELLRIGIEDLKAYLDKNKLRMAMEVLTQAIDYAKAKKTWKFWVCCRCGERVSESDSDDHLWDHLATLSSGFLSHSPDEPPEWAVNMIENGVWKPVESICAAEIMERRSAAADWPYVDDIERAEIIERIRKKLQLFTSNKCLAWSHLNWLQYLIIELLQNHIPKPVITDLWLHHTLHLIRFLEVPGLNHVLEFLEDLASVCALGCLGVLLSEDDVRGNQWFWDNARERVVFSSDFSALLFDDRLLRGETVEPDIGVAVVTSSTTDEDCDADSDALVYWLWTEGPTIVEQIKAWTSLTEACKCQGMEFYNIIEAESLRLQRIGERKCEYLRYQKPLANVDSICVEENWKREQISGYHPQGYVSLFFKRWKELEAEGDAETGSSSSCELDIIWSIMKESQSQSEIQMVILKQKDRLARELCQLDAIIMSTLAAMRQTGLQAGMVSTLDYRFALVPQLKSFMKAHLEDLVNEDAAEKSNAVAEALLAELALDAKKNANQGGRQGLGKSKDKKKKKDHRKAKDSESAGGSEEQHPTSVPVVSSEPNEDVGSSELQHLSQSGPAPLPLSGIQFGHFNWTNFCQAQSFKR